MHSMRSASVEEQTHRIGETPDSEEMTGKERLAVPTIWAAACVLVHLEIGLAVSRASAIPSRFAPSLTLMRRIEGETTMVDWLGV